MQKKAGGAVKKLAPFLVILAGCCWATMGIFVRHLNTIGLASMEIVEARSMLTAVIMLLALAVFRRDLLKVRAKDLWCFAGGGIISIILFNFCYFQTIQLASLSTAAILLYTSPIFVLLLSVPLFGEKLTRRKLICLAMAFGGCALASGLASGLAWDPASAMVYIVFFPVSHCSGDIIRLRLPPMYFCSQLLEVFL